MGVADLSLCEVDKALYDILYDKGIEDFDNWNKSKAEPSNDSIKFVSASSPQSMPDYDFIDLDALLRNVCISIRDERRKNDEFDKKHLI